MGSPNVLGWGGTGARFKRRPPYYSNREIKPVMIMTVLHDEMTALEIADALSLEYDLNKNRKCFMDKVRRAMNDLLFDGLVEWRWRQNEGSGRHKVWCKR